MKNIFKILLMIILVLPIFVYADNMSYQIETKVTLEGKELEANEFTFELYQLENNGKETLIDTKTNDADGNVKFKNISYSDNDLTNDYCTINKDTVVKKQDSSNYPYYDIQTNIIYYSKCGYKLYKIIQKNKDSNYYTLDNNTIYVGVDLREDKNNVYSTEINYLSSDDIYNWKNKYSNKKENDSSKIYHATDDELKGQLYAAVDTKNLIATVFRDDENKYINGQKNGDVYYYIIDESKAFAFASVFENGLMKKIIIKDSIRPISGYNLFSNFPYLELIEGLEKIDTSKITDMSHMFESDYSLKALIYQHLIHLMLLI